MPAAWPALIPSGQGSVESSVEHGQLGVAAFAHRGRAQHPVADPRDRALPRSHDLARDLHSRREGQRGLLLVAALADQDVGEVAGHGVHPDEHLPRPRLGIGHLPPGEHVRRDHPAGEPANPT